MLRITTRYSKFYMATRLPFLLPFLYPPVLHLCQPIDADEAHWTKVFFAVVTKKFNANVAVKGVREIVKAKGLVVVNTRASYWVFTRTCIPRTFLARNTPALTQFSLGECGLLDRPR
jgi:hypothetical protein